MNKLPEKDQTSAVAIIQQIKDGGCNPKTLNKDMRQQCVEVLMAEGYSKVQMAQVLKVSEKTIKRDIDEIFLRNSLMPDENLKKRITGQLVLAAAIHRDHLMRLARKTDASVAERSQAEYLAYKILTDFIERLQSLGYLPARPQAIVGDISLNVQEKSFEDLRKELKEFQQIIIESGGNAEEFKGQVEQVSNQIDKAEITHNLQQLKAKSAEVDHEQID
jgi:hypothetical protein